VCCVVCNEFCGLTKGEDVSLGIWLSAVKPSYIDVSAASIVTRIVTVLFTHSPVDST